jgi:hypothetical protein
MPITPDTKDWTWVLERPCPDCGFDADDHPKEALGADVRATAAAWSDQLRRPDTGARPDEATWSVLEYGCHVRDVFRIFDTRLALMLTEDDPQFADWDQDETAVADRYDLQDPDTVRVELVDAAAALADRFGSVTPDGWARTGRRSNGSDFTVETLGVYLVHDPIHHLWDVRPAD